MVEVGAFHHLVQDAWQQLEHDDAFLHVQVLDANTF